MWRYSGDWMVIWDDRILELLFNEGTGTPTEIAKKEGIAVGRSHVTKRLSKLAEKGLCDNLGNGVYCLDTEGVGYLLGQFDVQNNEWIGLSDARVTFAPSHKLSNRWAFIPDCADMYNTHINTIEQKLKEKSKMKTRDEKGLTSDSQERWSKSEKLDTGKFDTSKKELPDGTVEHSNFGSTERVKKTIEQHGIERAKKEFPDYDFTQLDDKVESSNVGSTEFWVKKAIEQNGIEKAKEEFPDYDFTQLDDIPEPSNAEPDEA